MQLGKRGRRFEQKKSCLEYADVFCIFFGGCFASLFQSDWTCSAMRLPMVGSRSMQKTYCTWTAGRSSFASRWKIHVAGTSIMVFLESDDPFFYPVGEHTSIQIPRLRLGYLSRLECRLRDSQKIWLAGRSLVDGVIWWRSRLSPSRGKGLAAPRLVTCQHRFRGGAMTGEGSGIFKLLRSIHT